MPSRKINQCTSFFLNLTHETDTASFMSPPQNQHPVPNPITMAALWNRAGRLYFHPVVCSSSSFFLLLSFFFSSPNPSGRRLDVYHTSTDGSANLECGSKTCCKRLPGNTGRENDGKKSPSAHHHTTLSGCIFTTKACINNQKRTC